MENMENNKNQVIMIKLATGEVVMGKLKEDTDTEITLEKPMTLMLNPMQGSVGMIPYDVIYTQEEPEEMTWIKNHVIHGMKVHSQFEEAYIKETTGIETVTPEIIA